MADLSVTPANVLAGVNAKVKSGKAGATIVAGKTIVKNPTTGKMELADCNGASAYLKGCDGVALNGGSDGQPIDFVTEGDINPGATVVIGTVYVLSGTPGGIKPVADLASADNVTIIGVGTAANKIAMNIQASGVAVP